MTLFYPRENYCPKCGCYKEAEKEFCNSHMQAFYDAFSKRSSNDYKGDK